MTAITQKLAGCGKAHNEKCHVRGAVEVEAQNGCACACVCVLFPTPPSGAGVNDGGDGLHTPMHLRLWPELHGCGPCNVILQGGMS
eukprot:366501-Chlamydomonas_euryale.AAC.18